MFDDLKQAYLPRTRFPERTVDREKCARCGRCSDACPTWGFRVDAEGFPVPQGYGGMEQACLNCWNCVAVCPTGALALEGTYFVPEGRYRSLGRGEIGFPDPLGQGPAAAWEEADPELTEVERVIYRRRSVRLFQERPVPRELLARVVEAGQFAPSSGNCMPWKFIVITDRELIREVERQAMKVLRRMKNLYYDPAGKRRAWRNALFSASSWVAVNKIDPRPFTAMEKADRCGGVIYWNAPAVILVAKNGRGIGNPDLDGGIAAQNMVLAAHSLGLGTCYIGLAVEPLTYPHLKKLRERLGIVPPWEPLTSIAVGYPRGRIDGIVKRDRAPVEWFEGEE